MHAGQYISAIGHAGLIGWVLFGNPFNAEPLPLEAVEVTSISAAEFAALTDQTPVAVAPSPAQPDAPEQTDPAPAPAPPDAPAEAPRPETPPASTPDPEPAPPEPAPSEADVEDVPPTPPAPPQPEDVATIAPPKDVPPQVRDVPRVAPAPVPTPPTDVTVDDTPTPATRPDQAAEETQPEQPASAPEEVVTRITPENTQPSSALQSSLRPKSRPRRPAPAPAPSEPTPPAPSDALTSAIADAVNQAQTPSAQPAGPPLTSGERDALRVAVAACWNVGILSSEALRTKVTVGVRMTREAKPEPGSIRMISASGGSDQAVQKIYEAARRAILRCGAKGFELPRDKYDQWRDIEMTFNPEKMRRR